MDLGLKASLGSMTNWNFLFSNAVSFFFIWKFNFISLYLAFSLWMNSLSLTIQLKAKLSGAFLWCCLFCCTLVQGGSDFWVCGWNPKVWAFKGYRALRSCGSIYHARVCAWKPKLVIIQMKATEQYFPVALFIVMYKVALAFAAVHEILKWTISVCMNYSRPK